MRRFLLIQLFVGLLALGCDDGPTQTPVDLHDTVDEGVAAEPRDLVGDDGPVDVDGAAPDSAELTEDVGLDVADKTAQLDSVGGADPNRPHKDLEGLRDGTLRTALYNLIKDQTALGYDVARDEMYAMDTGLDVRDGWVECIYTGTLAMADGTHTMGGSFNTEHSWPQSAGASAEPARSDLHHLFPVLDSANLARSNNPFGETDCDIDGSCLWEMAASALGPSVGSGQRVFEVRPVRRGDIARAQFYFSLRYQMQISGEVETTLKDWNRADPPDNRERVRNDRIELLQGNRNPFIDRSDFVDLISDF